MSQSKIFFLNFSKFFLVLFWKIARKNFPCFFFFIGEFSELFFSFSSGKLTPKYIFLIFSWKIVQNKFSLHFFSKNGVKWIFSPICFENYQEEISRFLSKYRSEENLVLLLSEKILPQEKFSENWPAKNLFLSFSWKIAQERTFLSFFSRYDVLITNLKFKSWKKPKIRQKSTERCCPFVCTSSEIDKCITWAF